MHGEGVDVVLPRSELSRGIAAGVPYVLRRPSKSDAPLVLIWHLGDPPRSAAAMAAATPLLGVDAWRLYLTLPMAGERMPPGGVQEVMRLASEDPVLNLFGPVQSQAVRELPDVLQELQKTHGLQANRVALVGGSMGGAVALTVLAELELPVIAASLLVPAVQLRALVDGLMEQFFGAEYPWAAASLAVAKRFDFVARAPELARSKALRVQVLLGERDAAHINGPAEALHAALSNLGIAGPVHRIAGLQHALAEEPGLEPAPQTAAAKRVDEEVTRFLSEALHRTP